MNRHGVAFTGPSFLSERAPERRSPACRPCRPGTGYAHLAAAARATAAEETDAAVAVEWEKLGQWIAEIFVPWYRITRTQLPDCWALHPDALVELSWLRSAHIDAYLPSAVPDRAATWHTRWRPSVLLRLREIAPESSCPPGEHLLTEEQRARRWEHRTPDDGRETGEPTRSERAPLPHEQLGVRRHWHGFYAQAVEADLSRRP